VYVLDTDVLTIIQRRAGEEFESLADYLDSTADDVFVSIVSFEEQMRGWLAAIAKVRAVEREVLPYLKLHELLDDFQTRPILDFDDAAAEKFNDYRRQRVRVGTMDLKIAAIVTANDAILVTRNHRDFAKIPGLKLSPWRG